MVLPGARRFGMYALLALILSLAFVILVPMAFAQYCASLLSTHARPGLRRAKHMAEHAFAAVALPLLAVCTFIIAVSLEAARIAAPLLRRSWKGFVNGVEHVAQRASTLDYARLRPQWKNVTLEARYAMHDVRAWALQSALPVLRRAGYTGHHWLSTQWKEVAWEVNHALNDTRATAMPFLRTQWNDLAHEMTHAAHDTRMWVSRNVLPVTNVIGTHARSAGEIALIALAIAFLAVALSVGAAVLAVARTAVLVATYSKEQLRRGYTQVAGWDQSETLQSAPAFLRPFFTLRMATGTALLLLLLTAIDFEAHSSSTLGAKNASLLRNTPALATETVATNDVRVATIAQSDITPLELMLKRRMARMLDSIPKGTHSDVLIDSTHPSGLVITDLLGIGKEGQALMVQNGAIVWSFPNATGTGRLPREMKGEGAGQPGRRSGGGGGGNTSSATTTTITQTIDSDEWTDAGGFVYLTNTVLNVGIGTTTPETKLEVIGTMSGTALTISSLRNCDTIDTDASGNLVCGTDTGGGGTFGSGNVIAVGNSKYVDVAGDTMTGALVIQNGSTHSPTGTALLNVRGVASGVTLYATTSLRSSGSLVWEGAGSGNSLYIAQSIQGAGLADCDLATQTLAWDATTGRFSCGTDSDTTYSAGQNLTLNGTSFSLNTTITGSLLEFGTVSGTTVYGQQFLRSSGSLVWEGAGSGASLYIGGSLQGVGLSDCDTAGSSKLLWDATTGRFSCGSDQNTGTSYTAGQGLSLNSTAFSLSTSISGSLLEFTTVSGTTVYGQRSLRSSGALTWEGAGSGASLYLGGSLQGAGLSDCDTAATSKLLWDVTTGRFSCGTDQTGGGGGGVLDYYVLASGDTMTGALTIDVTGGTNSTIGLKVLNTLSGAILHAENSITSSGSITARNDIRSLKGSIFGRGLVFASGATVVEQSGFNEYLNFIHSGLGTNSVVRMTNVGNLVNIGSIQAGEAHFRNGGTFVSKVDYTIGSAPSIVAMADLNGDGKQDLAVANDSSTTVSVLLNRGNGTYASKVDYSTGVNPKSLAVGDLNGDGRNDIAVGNYTSNTVSIFLNNGSGTFLAKVDYGTATHPNAVAIGDLNGDGRMDLAVANNGSTSVSVLLNNGNGTFATKTDYTAGNSPQSVAIGDFNGDGKQDMVVANVSGTSVSVFLNIGNGTFASKVNYTTGSLPYSVAVGDVNGDGKLDMATSNYTSTTVSVFINTGSGGFVPKVDYATGANPISVAIGDVNGDGKADLVTTNYGTTTASVLLNNGYGTFLAKVDYTVGTAPYSVAIGDINGDGKSDLAVANNGATTVSVLMNNARTILFASPGTGGVVGIGTAAPSEKLTVSGSILINTDISTATINVFKIISDVGSANDVQFRITGSGAVYSDAQYNSAGADYAEWFFTSSKDVLPGEVVCIDVAAANTVKRCDRDGDDNVMGIVSTNPAFIGNVIGGAEGLPVPGTILVGLIGQVPAHVVIEGSGGVIRPGDSLTAASIPGYARKAQPGESTVGVALEPLASGQGIINVLISRRNQSLSVEGVEQHVLEQINAMEIGDEVELMVAQAMGDLNVDQSIIDEVTRQVDTLNVTDAVQQEVARQVAPLREEFSGLAAALIHPEPGTVPAGPDLEAATLQLTATLSVDGDARIVGDLHLDGALITNDLFVPGVLAVDGSLTSNSLTVTGDSDLYGTTTLHGPLVLGEGSSLQFGSGMTLADLVVEHSLMVLGDITIDGMATFLGDVAIEGELTVSNNQTGFAVIPKGSTGVTVTFPSPFKNLPVVTATSADFVTSPWRVRQDGQVGFTIELQSPMDEDVTFSWLALTTKDALTTGDASDAETLDEPEAPAEQPSNDPPLQADIVTPIEPEPAEPAELAEPTEPAEPIEPADVPAEEPVDILDEILNSDPPVEADAPAEEAPAEEAPVVEETPPVVEEAPATEPAPAPAE